MREMKKIEENFENDIIVEIEKIRKKLPNIISQVMISFIEEQTSIIYEIGVFQRSVRIPISINNKDEKINYSLLYIIASKLMSELKNALTNEVLQYLDINILFDIESKDDDFKEVWEDVFGEFFGDFKDDGGYINGLIIRFSIKLNK